MLHTDAELHAEAHSGTAYPVQLKQLGDPMERLRQAGHARNLTLAGIRARRLVKFAFSIHPIDPDLQKKSCSVHFHLIFDQDVPLWRVEYSQATHIPAARTSGSSVQVLTPRTHVSSARFIPPTSAFNPSVAQILPVSNQCFLPKF